MSLYDLRHSCASLLPGAAVNPKIVSERLGHASIVLTLDTYSHVLPTMQEAAKAILESVMFGRPAHKVHTIEENEEMGVAVST